LRDKGVYAEFHFGFISNNLLGQFATRLVSSDLQRSVLKETHGAVAAKRINIEIIRHPSQFYLKGSFDPVTEKIVRYQEGTQGWI
jgi:hypothetical protein